MKKKQATITAKEFEQLVMAFDRQSNRNHQSYKEQSADFNVMLKDFVSIEEIVGNALTNSGLCVLTPKPEGERSYDLLTTKGTRIEVKSDVKFTGTGNIFIETNGVSGPPAHMRGCCDMLVYLVLNGDEYHSLEHNAFSLLVIDWNWFQQRSSGLRKIGANVGTQGFLVNHNQFNGLVRYFVTIRKGEDDEQ